MASEIGSLYVKIGAETSGLQNGLNQAKSGLSGFAQNASLALIGLNQGLQVAQQIAQVAKQAYEGIKQGADLQYTADKFTRLSAAIGVTSDSLMNDLRDATRGTMSDMQLAASASDLMALGLAKDREEVIRLSTVAGGLGMNMNQLVLALTNQTTARFDQLGVKVDGFKEKVAALEESGMNSSDAFKEAFLQQAEEQLASIGNKADSAAGAYARLDASMANLADTAKRRLAPALVGVADTLSGYTYQQYEKSLEKGAATIAAAKQPYEDYAAALDAEAKSKDYIVNAAGDLVQVYQTETGAVELLIQAHYRMNEAEYTNYRMGDMLTESKRARSRITEEYNTRLTRALSLTSAEAKLMGDQSFAERSRAFSIAETSRKMDELQIFMSGPVGNANKQYKKQLQELQEALSDTGAQIKKLKQQPWKSDDLKEAEKQYGEIKTQIVEVEEQHSKSSKQMIYNLAEQRLAQDGINAEEADFLAGLAKQSGLIDEDTLQMWNNLKFPLDSFSAGELTAQKTLDILERMATTWKVNIEFQTNMPSGVGGPLAPSVGQQGGNPFIPGMYASGGVYSAGRPRIVGENGPELDIPASGGRVISNAETRDLLSGQKVTQNITVNLSLPQSGYSATQLVRELQRLGG